MAKPNKIEKYHLQKLVAKCVADGLSTRQIAVECSRVAKEDISHVAVSRYLELMGSKRREVIRNPDKVSRITKMDIDLIELQYRTTSALLERFEALDNLPATINQRMDELAERIIEDHDIDSDYLHKWKIAFVDEIRRNVQNITALNRELRENGKFMMDMREKAFEFSLVQEYLYLFMEHYREVNEEAYEIVAQRIATNPRMQRIVEQQQQLRGEMEDAG